MFYFDEDREVYDAHLESDDEQEVMRREFMGGQHFSIGSRHERSGQDVSMMCGYAGRDSERGFFGAGELFESDDGSTSSDEVDDRPAELVPMGIKNTRRNRQRSGTETGFLDFYKLTDENLGAGAYASVRTCVSRTTSIEYAVKVVDKSVQSHTRSRIAREVETFRLCRNHPNIVQLVDWFEDHDNFYMVFEKMRGGPLLDHIQRKKFFTEHEASMVTKDIASALKFLHDKGIAHRDVKPENILCTERDHVSPVKLCDLDLASKAVLHQQRMPMVASEPDLASPVGSAEFMAPEVVGAFVNDSLKYDKRCDMWSLGVIIYIMLCGYPPFYGDCSNEDCGWDQGEPCDDCQNNLFARIQMGEFEFPYEEWEDISEDAKHLISRLLVKNVKERYTADDVLAHLWVANGGPNTKLLTPGNLFRNDSARDVHQISEHFNVMNRLVAQRLSSRFEVGSPEERDEGIPILRLNVDCSVMMMSSHPSPTAPPPFQSEDRENDPEVEMVSTPFMFQAPPPHDSIFESEYSPAYYNQPVDLLFGQPMHDMNNTMGRASIGGVANRLAKLSTSHREATPPQESCQSAIAKQDSMNDICTHQQREQQVNV